MTDFEDVVAALNNMSDAQLSKLSFLISQRISTKSTVLSGGVSIAPQSDADLNLFYKAVVQGLPDAAAWPPSVNFLKLRSKSTYKSVRKAYDQVSAVTEVLLNDNKNNKVSKKVLKVKLFRLFSSIAIQNLNAANVPISLRQVLSQSSRFIGLLDHSFPGYVKTGNLHLIIEAIELGGDC